MRLGWLEGLRVISNACKLIECGVQLTVGLVVRCVPGHLYRLFEVEFFEGCCLCMFWHRSVHVIRHMLRKYACYGHGKIGRPRDTACITFSDCFGGYLLKQLVG